MTIVSDHCGGDVNGRTPGLGITQEEELVVVVVVEQRAGKTRIRSVGFDSVPVRSEGSAKTWKVYTMHG